MLLNRLIHKLSRKIRRIYKCANWQIGLYLTEQKCSRKHPRKQIFCTSSFCLFSSAFLLGIITITLPVFFNTVAQAQWQPPTLKAQESAAKQYVAAMNKAQQSYYANNRGFTTSVSNLGIGIKPDTANYKYSINTEVFSTEHKAVFNYAVSNQANLRSFVGGVYNTHNILCINVDPGKIKPALPSLSNQDIGCGVGTVIIAQ